MKLFQNRAIAVLLAIFIVAGSTLLNTQIKLSEQCRQVQDGFFASEEGSKSIYAYLSARLDATNGLWTILINHDAEAAAALNQARAALLDAYDARDISGMYGANSTLQQAFDTAAASAAGYDLTSSESDALNDYTINFAGAQKMIDKSGYNTSVLDFTSTTYDKFPANLLAPLVGVEAPELFA
jgi:hypothetical protein